MRREGMDSRLRGNMVLHREAWVEGFGIGGEWVPAFVLRQAQDEWENHPHPFGKLRTGSIFPRKGDICITPSNAPVNFFPLDGELCVTWSLARVWIIRSGNW